MVNAIEVQGTIDSISRGHVYGWAWSPEQQEPMTVELWIDARKLLPQSQMFLEVI